MPRPGSVYVRITDRFHGVPLMVACLLVMLVQGAILDVYLIRHHGVTSFGWLAFDAINLVVFVASFVTTRQRIAIRAPQRICPFVTLGWLAWLLYAAGLVTRWSVIFVNFSWELKEEDLLGPNALKTTLAVSSGVFLLLLVTNHNSRRSSYNIPYIEELTESVVFDIIDTVDILDVLFDREAREIFPFSLEAAILGLSGINIMIPTIPLATLSLYDYGRKKLPRRLLVLHKLLLAFAVNLPYFVMRMVLWHAYRVAISPFCVKNVVVIVVVLYGFFTHKKEEMLTKESRAMEVTVESADSEDKDLEDVDVEAMDDVQLRRASRGKTEVEINDRSSL